MKKDVQFLSKGLFASPLMQSRIKTHSMTFKEKALGFFVGPAGIIVYAAVITNLKELFYTSVVPIDNLFGTGTYLAITTISSLIGLAVGVLMGWVIDHTVSPAGKIRPYILIASIVMLLSGVGLFSCPFAQGSTGQLVWLFVFNILYSGLGINMFAIRFNKIALSTRNLRDRSSVTTIYTAADNIISGVIVGMLISSILYYRMLANDITGNNWRMMVNITAIIAIPLMFVEYFYTRERVTEENLDTNRKSNGEVTRTPIKEQMKALVSNKYWLLSQVIILVGMITVQMQGTNIRTNYCQWVLGATAENNLQIMYMAIAMAPMGVGIALIFPLVKKLGARKLVMAGGLVSAISGLFCMLFPANIGVAFAGSFIFSFGTLAMTYVSNVFLQQANDIIEYEHGFRAEGCLAASIVASCYSVICTPLSGLYETVLMKLGYNAYSTAGQSEGVIRWIVFVWFGLVVVKGLVTFLCLIPFDAEKIIDSVQSELKERHKNTVLARGEEWIDHEEQERLQREESERRAEEDRIADLRALCQRKGLDFDTENQKYLDKKARKEQRKKVKQK